MQEQVLDRLAEDKTLAAEAWANTIAVLTCDDVEKGGDGEDLSQLAIRLLNIWMQSVQRASQEDNSAIYFKSRLVKGGLLSYGKKRPKVGLFRTFGAYGLRFGQSSDEQMLTI